jgi:hypothetical protein
MWREAMTGKHGGDRKSEQTIRGDNVTLEPKRQSAQSAQSAVILAPILIFSR